MARKKDAAKTKYIVTHIPIKETYALNDRHPLLVNGPINTHFLKQKMVFSMGAVPRSSKRTR
jgi:hypothetical protein